MNFNFKTLDRGAQVSLIACGLALISQIIPGMGFWNHDHYAFFEVEYIIFLPLLYPLLVISLGKKLNVFAGVMAVVIALVAGSILQNVYFMDQHTDPKLGLFVFLAAALGALYGLVRWSLPKNIPATDLEDAEN